MGSQLGVTLGCHHSALYRKMLSHHSSHERGSPCGPVFLALLGHTEPKFGLPTVADSAGFPAGLRSVF